MCIVIFEKKVKTVDLGIIYPPKVRKSALKDMICGLHYTYFPQNETLTNVVFNLAETKPCQY